VVLTRGHIVLIVLHESQNESIEFVKLFALLFFAQYVIRIGTSALDHLAELETAAKDQDASHGSARSLGVVQPTSRNFRRELALVPLRIFQAPLNLHPAGTELGRGGEGAAGEGGAAADEEGSERFDEGEDSKSDSVISADGTMSLRLLLHLRESDL
jgi:hypothetical protein